MYVLQKKNNALSQIIRMNPCLLSTRHGSVNARFFSNVRKRSEDVSPSAHNLNEIPATNGL